MTRAFSMSLSYVATAVIVAAALVAVESVPRAQEQPAPAGGAAGGAGGRGGPGRGGGRGGPVMTPSALRAIPAETTAAKATDPAPDSTADDGHGSVFGCARGRAAARPRSRLQ